jgi:hypothetical protein
VEQAFASLPAPDVFPLSDQRFFSGGRASAAARAQLLGFAERLVIDGEAGAVLVVNLASRDHLDSLAAGEPACAVLFAGESEDAFSEPLEQPPKKGRPGSPRGLPRAIDLSSREAQAEPGLSTRLTALLLTAWHTFREWLRGRRESS